MMSTKIVHSGQTLSSLSKNLSVLCLDLVGTSGNITLFFLLEKPGNPEIFIICFCFLMCVTQEMRKEGKEGKRDRDR